MLILASRRRQWRRLLLAALLAGFAVATTARPAGADATAITIQHYMYMPAAPTVQVGDTVTWTNMDDAPHTVTGTGGPERLDGPQLNKGEHWSFTFTQAGTYSYYCEVHPDMRAQLTVQAASPATTQPAPAVSQQSQQRPTAVAAATRTRAAVPAQSADAAAAPQPAVDDMEAPTPTILAVTKESGPALSPWLILAAVATTLAVFGLLALEGPRRPPDQDPPSPG